MISPVFRLALIAALPALVAAAPAQAATPASGSVSPAQPTLSYGSGPFAVANTSTTTSPAAPVCMEPAQPCDDFALTVDVPANYLATHPHARLFVATRWPVNNFFAYNLYLLDATGAVLEWQATERDPAAVSIPAAAGRYTIRILPQQGSPGTLTTTVDLLEEPTGPAATGIAPRFLVQQSPAGLGDQVGGEMNIGFNPKTGRAMTLAYTQTLRTTFPDRLTPALPECCASLWEDVSDSRSNQNTNDPILFTDQATGRTFVSQLQAQVPSDSIFVYTDDDGDNWTLTPSTIDGGVDHQTVGAGPYSAGDSAGPTGTYPDAVYYCSQSVAAAFCMRSDDGGATFLAPSVLKTSVDCDGFTPNIHGHVRVAPDGTAYVPDRNCGGVQAVIASEDSGSTWEVRRVPGTTAGDNDSSVGIAGDGTLYLCYVAADAHVHAVVSKDRGLSWINDRDIGYAAGVVRAVFPNAIAGDPDRAGCAFIGTTTPGNYQATDFEGLWYVYAAMTYDGGNSWHTVNPIPDDPVQGKGGICLGGTTCIQNRNLLDFNEITLDDQGRLLYGYNDGCLGDCIATGIPNQLDFFGVIINTAAKSTILRQSGGRRLLSAFDMAEPHAPQGACLSGGRDDKLARLVWKIPDHGGAEIAGYRIYRGTAKGAESPVAFTGVTRSFDDASASAAVASYFYKITAVNNRGEGIFSNTVELKVGDALPEVPPGGGGTPPPVTPPAVTPPAQTVDDHARFGGSALGSALLLPLATLAFLRRQRRTARRLALR